MGSVVEIKGLSAAYGPVFALQDLSLEIEEGEILGLVGPNGAGKTTLIKVVSGIMKPSSGSIAVNGIEITGLDPAKRARMLAVVPQAHQLGGAFTVNQAVMLGRTAHLDFLGRPGKDDLEHVRWAMDKADLAGLADRKLAEISGGEQQRVLLARALAQDTPVMLLDEPTNHLDLKYQVDLLRLLKDLALNEKITILMAMHDLNQVSGIVDRVALLKEGRMMALGLPNKILTPENIRAAYQAEVETFTHPGSNQHLIIPTQ